MSSSSKFVHFPMDWKIRWSEFYSIKNRPFVEKRIVTSFNNVPIRWYVRVQEEMDAASGLECFFYYVDGPMEKIDGQNGIEFEICIVNGDGTIGAVQTLKLQYGMDSGWNRLFDNDFTNVRGKCDSTSKTTGDTDRFVLQLTIKIPIKIFSFTMPPGPTPKPCAPWLTKLFKTINDPERSRFSDAKLLSRDEVVFYCHRNVIAAQSEQLAKIFRDRSEDDQQPSATKVTNNYSPSSVESNATYESALSVLEDESITTIIESASSAVVETVSKKRKEDEYYDIPSMGAASIDGGIFVHGQNDHVHFIGHRIDRSGRRWQGIRVEIVEEMERRRIVATSGRRARHGFRNCSIRGSFDRDLRRVGSVEISRLRCDRGTSGGMVDDERATESIRWWYARGEIARRFPRLPRRSLTPVRPAVIARINRSIDTVSRGFRRLVLFKNIVVLFAIRRPHLVTFNGRPRCVCGVTYDQHPPQTLTTTNWTPEKCIRKFPTNAFGRIQFYPADLGSSKPAKYVRLADDSNLKSTIDLFTRYWRLIDYVHRPEIVISVVGGAGHFGLADGIQKKLLDRELMKAVETTNGWLLTDGLDGGVAKAIGRATKQSQSLMWQTSGTTNLRNTIQCIGIAAWSTVQNANSLINLDFEKLNKASYTIGASAGKNLHPLNPHHTHFLLVDDGCYNGELDAVAHFRAELERKIAQPIQNGGLAIPVICMLIEGGLRSIERVAQSVLHEVPVLICDGTGRAANLVASACRQYDAIQKFADKSIRRWRLTDFRHHLPELVAEIFFLRHLEASMTVEQFLRGKYGRLVEKCVENILIICERRRMVYIFNVNGHSTLDTAILMCLLECKKVERHKQLELALRWNRADVARAKIFTSNATMAPGGGSDQSRCGDDWKLFGVALRNDLTEFVRLFVDYGLDLKNRLTVTELRMLYSKTMTNRTLAWYILHLHRSRPKHKLDLSDINNLLNHRTRRFHHPIYAHDRWDDFSDKARTTTFRHPFQELFLWAVVLGRRSLALYFWEQCAEPLTTAIVGTLICDTFHKHAENWSSAASDNLIALKSDLESLAINLIQKAFFGSVKKTMVLLHRESTIWGNSNCMVLAALARDKAFLATEPCQRAIWDTWRRGFSASCSAIFFSTFTVVPVIFLCNFNKESELYDDTHGYHDYDFDTRGSASANGTMVNRRESRAGRVFARLDNDPNSIPLVTVPPQSPSTTHLVDASALCDDSTDAFGWQQCRGLFRHLSWLESDSHPEAMLKMRELSWWKKLQTFYTAPSVKFTYHTCFYLVYLFLYCYVILFAYRPQPTNEEIVLQIWTYSMMFEEIYMIFTSSGDSFIDQWNGWWSYSSFSAWNRLDFFGPLLTCLAFGLRWSSITFNLSRLFLNINFIVCMFRLFKVYYVNSYLGPKVVMIKRMTWDLAMFFGVLIIILLSYTVVSQSMLHPYRSYFHGIYWELLYHGVWVLFGELQEEISQVTVPDCRAQNGTVINNGTDSDFDCFIRSWPPPILLGAYCFVGSILLVNMLIAAFTYIFEEVQSQSQQLWRYYMFFMVKEYDEKNYLPPPFNILEYIYRSIRTCWIRLNLLGGNKPDEEPWKENYEEFLRAFENAARSDLLDTKESSGEVRVDVTLQQLTEELRSVSNTLASIQAALGARKISKDVKMSTASDRKRSSREELDLRHGIRRCRSHENQLAHDRDADEEFTSTVQSPETPPPTAKAFLDASPSSTTITPASMTMRAEPMARTTRMLVLAPPKMKESSHSSPSLVKMAAVASDHDGMHSRSGSERDSELFDDFDMSMLSEENVLETFHDAKDSFR